MEGWTSFWATPRLLLQSGGVKCDFFYECISIQRYILYPVTAQKKKIRNSSRHTWIQRRHFQGSMGNTMRLDLNTKLRRGHIKHLKNLRSLFFFGLSFVEYNSTEPLLSSKHIIIPPQLIFATRCILRYQNSGRVLRVKRTSGNNWNGLQKCSLHFFNENYSPRSLQHKR